MYANEHLASVPENEGPPSCLLQSDLSIVDILVGLPTSLIGGGVTLWGLMELNNCDIAIAGIGVAFFGAIVLGIGLFILFNKLVGSKQTIAVVPDGIELISKDSSKKLVWSEIN
ncbi:MAG: hypothetical protein FJ267_02730 [Planctomycetes bacterium]|nr:hypothetical protein [Planctomycetota bacterium]